MENALQYINAIGAVLAAAEAITPTIVKLIEDAKSVLDSGTVTDDQWAALHALQDQNTATLDAPMEGEGA